MPEHGLDYITATWFQIILNLLFTSHPHHLTLYSLRYCSVLKRCGSQFYPSALMMEAAGLPKVKVPIYQTACIVSHHKTVILMLILVCQETVSHVDAEDLITPMPGNGALQVLSQSQPPQKQQPSQHLLPEPLRPGSGQVTPVFGKTSWCSQRFWYLRLCLYTTDRKWYLYRMN
jgi:hypothetical protein